MKIGDLVEDLATALHRPRCGEVVEIELGKPDWSTRVRVFWRHPNGFPDKRTWVVSTRLKVIRSANDMA